MRKPDNHNLVGFFTKRIFALLFFLCFNGNLFASSAGTTSANFLKIPIAVIPASLGQSYTAMISPDSILFNPAGLGLLTYSSFSGSHNQYICGINQEYVAAAYRFKFGTIGLGYSVLNSGDIVAYDKNDMIIGNTGSSHRLLALSYAQSFPHFREDIGQLDPMVITPGWTKVDIVQEYRPKAYRISFGGSIKYIDEKLDNLSSSAYTFDLGILFIMPHHFHLGASALNISGSQNFYSDDSSLPKTLRAGIAKDFHTVKDIMVFTVISDAVKEADYDYYHSIGIDMDILRLFQIRMGYKTKKDIGAKVSGGIGMNLDRFTEKGSFIKGIRLDYAYVDYGNLGATHRFGFQFIW
ncbi:MAG: hypothetical protein L6420_02175 [Elusimicrobia bacterium]|nr:hypothetical protein [Elusimicrobiota bacterium]